MSFLTINVEDNPNDDELRRRARASGTNGEYVTQICKRCGMLNFSQMGDVRNAKIVVECSHCRVER